MNKHHTKYLLTILISFILFSQVLFAGPPDLTGRSAFLIERSTGTILYEKNANTKMYPASTTKILTSILGIENLDLTSYMRKTRDSVANVPIDSSHIGLEVGDWFTVLDGIHAIMLGSDNYVSHDLATLLDGSTDNFAKRMNEKSKEIGAHDSNFTNPHGYHEDNHYTTAHDLALIMNYALNNKDFKEIINSPSYNLTRLNNLDNPINFDSTVELLDSRSPYYNPYVIGGKTGYTKAAGRSLVAAAKKDDMELIGVILKSKEGDYFEDMNSLFDYGFNNFKLQRDDNQSYYIENNTYSPWAKDMINFCIDNNLISNTTQNYQSPISEKDFLQLLIRTIYISQNKDIDGFSNKAAIQSAIEWNLIPNDSILSGINNPITREEAAKLLKDLFDYINYNPVAIYNTNTYSDEHLAQEESLHSIYYLQARNIMGSIEDQNFYPDELLSLEDALSIISKIYKMYSASPYSYINKYNKKMLLY